jgi:hypothetical protein
MGTQVLYGINFTISSLNNSKTSQETPMTSFYQFYEQMMLSKMNEQSNFNSIPRKIMESLETITEGRPEGSNWQYVKRIAPSQDTNAGSDGSQGKTTKRTMHQTPEQIELDRLAAQANYEANRDPLNQEFDAKIRAASAPERKAHRDLTKQIGYKPVQRRGGGIDKSDFVRTDAEVDEPEALHALKGIPALLNQIEEFKDQITELLGDPANTPTEEWISNKEVMQLVHQLYKSIEIASKHSQLTGEEGEEIKETEERLAELIRKEREARMSKLSNYGASIGKKPAPVTRPIQ